MTDFIAEKHLDDLRRVGDPALDEVVAATQAGELRKAAQAGRLFVGEARPQLQLLPPPEPTVAANGDKLLHAQRLFVKYGNEIGGALLLAALPQSYAARWGAGALVASSGLHHDFRQRIIGTAQFLLLVTRGADTAEAAEQMWDQAYEPGGVLDPPWKACHILRSYHARIRHDLEQRRESEPRVRALLGDRNTPPLNQEDLLAMLLTFTVSVFEVLERCGIFWSADEQEAYLHLWDVIGDRLGIGTPAVRDTLPKTAQEAMARQRWVGLRPPTIEGTRQLLDQLRRRLWWHDDREADARKADARKVDARKATDQKAADRRDQANGAREDPWTTPRPGQVLAHALLAEMARAMPPRMRSMPQLAVRKLAPTVVRDALLLGGGGLVSSLAEILPGGPLVEDPYAPPGYTNPVDARVTRLMVNEVTRHVVVHFLRTGRLTLPGLEDWSDGLVENGGGDQPRGPLRAVSR
jgi:hypothetical protein